MMGYRFDGHTNAVESGGPGTASTAPDLADNLCGGADMSDRTCSIAGCVRPLYARTLCRSHYRRAAGAGRLKSYPLRYTASLCDRLLTKRSVTSTGCWEFTGSLSASGYGSIGVGSGRTAPTHRVAYELFVGPIPDGLGLDHLCRNRACFNPAHLEPVTPRVNTLRGVGVTAVNAQKTHCPQGHPYDIENTIRLAGGARRCRTCKRQGDREYRSQRS